MFATRLLKILETLPTDADNGGCVVDTPEEKATMKENQNGILTHSNSYKEANSLIFPTKDLPDSNGYVSCKETLACDTKDTDELWKVSEVHQSVLFDDISRSNNDRIRASILEDGVNEALPNIITSRRYDTKDNDQQYWNTPEFECLMISNLTDEKENEPIVPNAPVTSDTTLYTTDKCFEEYELPEIVACYKESDCNIVENICMENSWNNAHQPGTYVSIPADDEDRHSNTSDCVDTESCSAGGSRPSVEYENIEEEDAAESQDGLIPTSQDEVNNVSDNTVSNLQDLILVLGPGGAKWKHTSQKKKKKKPHTTSLSRQDSSANVMLCPEEPGIEYSQQSKQPHQIATVTDFNSTKSASTSNMDQGVENIPEPSNKSFRDLLLDSQGYLADGEVSFSALGPESGQIVYSGRTSSSESISVGSDSSTTSAGSFAFPILQSEWNSSPVRMGQGLERKHLQKHRSWKQGILCCRFF